MYNQNYGYSSSSSYQPSTSIPFSSTPSNVRSSRPPRFGYSGPPSYPRPRSSASKPNPDGYTDSTGVPYDYPEDYLDNTRSKFDYPDDYLDNPSSKYPISEYNNTENYSGSSTMKSNYGDASEGGMNSSMRSMYGSGSDMNMLSRNTYGNSDAYVNNMRGTTDSMVNNYSNTNNRMDASFSSMNNTSVLSQNDTAYFTCNESFYQSPTKPSILGNSVAPHLPYTQSQFPLQNSGILANNRPLLQGPFKNKKDKFKAASLLGNKPKTTSKRRAGKKTMASKAEWRCTICSIEFTSGIPYDMHLRGARHAKKMKLQGALDTIQSQVAQNKEIAPVGTSFRCDLCNITANSTLQLQTHLDGTKHKNKLSQQQQSNEKNPEVNGKSNGAAVVRPVPAEFGEPQAKMCKFSCDTCNLSVNSEIQLQQHLTSKKHQAKVEGKPYPKKKFKPKKEGEENETEEKMDDNETEEKTNDDATGSDVAKTTMPDTGEPRKMVVGVKTLASSFVQGDTLH